MPLLEVVQTKHVSASIRLTDITASMLDQYAAYINAKADNVVEEALKHVFAKDRDFQEFLKTPQSQKVTLTLRIRRTPAPEPATQAAKPPVNGAASPALVAGAKA